MNKHKPGRVKIAVRTKAMKVEKAFDQAKINLKNKLGLIDPVILYPFRGYGNEHSVYLHGRVLEKEHVIHGERELEHNFWHNLRKFWKRYESDEVPGVKVSGELYGFTAETVSDREGYFTLEFHHPGQRTLQSGWHEVALKIEEMPFDVEYEEKAVGEVLIANQENAFGIISDVDDTILESHATNTFKRISTLIRHSAETRTAFEGVDKLYHSLIDEYQNPLFFISGSSYNLYDLLINFCEHHHIPKAPFLLRDLGLSARQWIKQDTMPYKLDYIRTLFNTYPRMSFICIGDSGQQDAEIYQQVYQEYPQRVRAIYIRHVDSAQRRKELEALGAELDVPFLIMSHSQIAIDHARSNGWIS